MRRTATAAAALAVLLLALAGPPAAAFFADPLPQRSDVVTAVAVDGDLIVAAHSSGLVLGLSALTGVNAWSAQPWTYTVHAAAAFGGVVAVAQGPELTGLALANGNVTWNITEPAFIAGLAAPPQAGEAVVALVDGTLAVVEPDGTQRTLTRLDAAPEAVARRGDLLAVATDAGLRVLSTGDPAQVASLDGPVFAVAWTGPDTGLELARDGTLRAFTFDGGALQTGASRVFGGSPTALAGRDGSAVLGDAGGLLHPLTATGADAQPPLATYANSVLDVAFHGTDAVVAFRGGWVGVVALDLAPMGLLLEPTAQGLIGAPAQVRWAYSDPDATGQDPVRHRILVRPPGASSWQVVATGFSPAANLTRLRSQDVDLAAFSGRSVDLRLELIDAQGHLRADQLSAPVLVDADPPVLSGQVAPPDGARIPSGFPTIGIGHHDPVSGIDAARTLVTLDGGVPLDVKRYASFTEARPLTALPDGRHAWTASVYDRAGNHLDVGGWFVTDTIVPVPQGIEATVHPNGADLTFTTPSPSTCAAQAGNAQASDGVATTSHVIVLSGLDPATSYVATLSCASLGGTYGSATQPFSTPGNPAGRAPPDLQATLLPEAPDGARGYYQAPPSLQAATTTDGAELRVSIDGGALVPLPPGLQLPQGNHTVLVEAQASDGQVAVRTLRAAVDATPPTAVHVTALADRLAVRWSPAVDLDSGIAAYHVEVYGHGAWSALPDVAAATQEQGDISPEAQQARVVAEDGAGLTSTSDPVNLTQSAQDEQFSSAAVAQPTVGTDGTITVHVVLVPPANGAEVVLVNADGVQTTFSDSVQVGPRYRAYTAPASAYQPGAYDVLVRLSDGTQLSAGGLVIHAVGNAASASQAPTTDTGAAQRSPAMAAQALVMVLAGCAVARRRRR